MPDSADNSLHALNQAGASFQSQFHQRWRHLTDPHVRALAWLIDAPDLLDPQAPQWRGQIAGLPSDAGHDAREWLAALDREPAELHAWLNVQPFARLGRYAEKLMAFYFTHQGMLFAHGVQVRAGKNETVGEFDFLLHSGAGLAHWEFATKFYLLQSPRGRGPAGPKADYFVGPNLADTLGAKMTKILHRQLSLGRHPAAQVHLPLPLSAAQALVKGWLFYHRDDAPPRTLGVSELHCRGFWCALGELEAPPGRLYTVLPRLRWLAPAKIKIEAAITGEALRELLVAHFMQDTMPVMVALLEECGEYAEETDRGFIVPDDWGSRARDRIRPVDSPA
ncbi:MAG: hypothetical protein JWQ23_780 [Herminiimonas sp.]|nr:hypothetical protein [Herminiimonas sp.]